MSANTEVKNTKMTKQELVNKLATRGNFHKYVEVCLDEGLKIQKLEFLPDVNIYHDFIPKDKDRVNWSGSWTTIRPDSIEFEVDGIWLSGVENFFRHYSKIKKIKRTQKDYYDYNSTKTNIWIVKPNMTGGKHWTIDNDFSANGHYEISFDANSFSKPAMVTIHNRLGEEIIEEKYMIEGVEVTKEEFIMESREHKLSRLCGVDLKAERLKKEKEEKEQEEKLKEEWNNNYSYYNCETDLPLLA